MATSIQVTFQFLLNLKNTKANTRRIENNKKVKLQVKFDQLEINPSNTGPIRKPANPIPDTIEIPTEAETPFVLPASLNNSGIITESPSPNIPKPKTVI